MNTAADGRGERSADDRSTDHQAARDGERFRVRPVVRPPRRDDDADELRVASRDETDTGWGDRPADRDAEWYRRQKPPHHE